MKNWFGAAGRFCADFLLVLILVVAIAALGASPAGTKADGLLAAALAAGLRLFPIAAIAAVFLGYHAFERRTGKRFLSLLSVLVLGFGLLAGFTEFRRLDLAPGLRHGKPLPSSGMVVENGSSSLFVGHYEGSSAVLALGYEADAQEAPRLFYSPRASYSPETGLVRIGGHAFKSLEAAEPARRFLPSIPGLEGRRLDERLAGLDSLPFPLALIVAGGIAFLAAGLAGFAGLPRWPLVGFFFGLAGVVILVLLDIALMSPPALLLAGKLAAKLGLARISGLLVVGCLEAFLGLVFAILALVAGRREAE